MAPITVCLAYFLFPKFLHEGILVSSCQCYPYYYVFVRLRHIQNNLLPKEHGHVCLEYDHSLLSILSWPKQPIENYRLIALLNNSNRICLEGCCMVRRLLFLMYGRPRKRLRHLLHEVDGGAGVASRSLFLGVCPSPLFHLSCTCGVCFAFGVSQRSRLLRKGFFHFNLLLFRKVGQMFHRHQFVPYELPTRDTLA